MPTGNGYGPFQWTAQSLPLSTSQRQHEALLKGKAASTRRQSVVDAIYGVIESELEEWEQFIVTLPPSAFLAADDRGSATHWAPPIDQVVRQKAAPLPNPSDEALLPSKGPVPLNEDLELSAYENGERKRLSKEQLESVWRTGSFLVPSATVEGEVHKWRVSPLLAEGKDNLEHLHRRSLASCISHIRYGIAAGITESGGASLYHCLEMAGSLLYGVASSTIGMPVTYIDLESLMQEERTRYILAYYSDALDDELATYRLLRLKSTRDLKETLRMWRELHPLGFLPRNEGASDGPEELDVRLWYDCLYGEVREGLVSEINRVQEVWRRSRGTLVRQLIEEHVTEDMGGEEVRHLVSSKYCEHLLHMLEDALRASAAVEPSLVTHYLAGVRVRRMEEAVAAAVDDDVRTCRAAIRKKLLQEAPIMGLVRQWMEGKVEVRLRATYGVREGVAMEEFLTVRKMKLLAQGIRDLGGDTDYSQELYLLGRAIEWEEEHMAECRRVTEKEKRTPMDVTLWRRRWGPVKKGEPRHTSVVVRTAYPGWRLWLLCVKAWTWTSNAACNLSEWMSVGPLGAKALFCASPFQDWHQRKVPTLASVLRGHVGRYAAARERFERQPDNGLLGKTVSRVFHRLFHGGALVFGFGVTAIGMPLLVGANLLVSAALLVTSVLWVPLVSVIVYLFNALLLDTVMGQSPVLWAILSFAWKLPFVLLAALLRLVVYHPGAAILTETLTFVYILLRAVWDPLAFLAIRRGRVPVGDSVAARQVSGPGFSYKVCHRVNPVDALAVLRLRLEQVELKMIENEGHALAAAPSAAYADLMEDLVGPLTSSMSPCAVRLTSEKSNISEMVSGVVRTRERLLPQFHGVQWARMTEEDLAMTLKYGEELVEEFCGKRLRAVLGDDEGRVAAYIAEKFGLDAGDHRGLASAILREAFGENFLTPLADSDVSLSLTEERSGSLTSFARTIMDTSKPVDPLERLSVSVEQSLYVNPPSIRTDVLPICCPPARMEGMRYEVAEPSANVKEVVELLVPTVKKAEARAAGPPRPVSYAAVLSADVVPRSDVRLRRNPSQDAQD